jgi:succinate dehydrogenase / fumarate reductase cytochrome b subunit
LDPQEHAMANAVAVNDSLNPHYLARKIHSLLGLIPVGVFLMFHLWENSMSRFGQEVFNVEVVKHIEKMLNYKLLAEAALIGAIFAHAIYGVVIIVQGRVNVGRYQYPANWRYLFQRITSVTTFAFIIWHLWQTRIAAAMDEAVANDLYSQMQRIYDNPVYVLLYLVGITGATFHFANGLWLFCINWGITTHPRSQRIASVACGVLFVLLTALGFHALWGFNHSFF